jgi:cytochrome P450
MRAAPGLPPGPRAPAAWQTVEWVARPTDLLRRAQAAYGEPFTLRILWADAPMVLTSDPAEIKRVFAAPPEQLRGGQSSAILEPFAGPSSILVVDGEEHMRRRKALLPAFHGQALEGWRETIAALARAEVATWPPGVPLRALPRMHVLTLEVILRVVFGAPDARLHAAIRSALDMAGSLPRLVALSLAPRGSRPWASFERAVARVDRLLYERIGTPAPEGSMLAALQSTTPKREELRDQLVTLLAAGHETTATALAWALERLARHPHVQERMRDGGDAYLDAVVKEVLRVRPVLSIAPRKVAAPFDLAGYTLPPGVHVAPCLYLAHRRPELWPEPTAFRPERFLDGAPEPYTWLPFGGGVRRCAGAAFATLEMREVLRAVAARWSLRASGSGERARRRSVTLAPAGGGYVLPEALASPALRACRSSAATTA